MSDDARDGVTLYAYTRADTPPSAGTLIVSQIADLYEFGLLGPGSTVWCNLQIPNSMWVLSDVSTYLHLIDVPFAGWVRVNQKEASWARYREDAFTRPGHTFGLAEAPLSLHSEDLCTLAYRNSDPALMRAHFFGRTQALEDYVTVYNRIRVVDLKTRGAGRRETPLVEPSLYDKGSAMQRGIELMTAGCGKNQEGVGHRREIIANLEAFRTVVSPDVLNRIRALQQRQDQAAQAVTDPILHRIAELKGFGGKKVGPSDADAVAEHPAGVGS